MQFGGAAHLVVDLAALERGGIRHGEMPGLERAHAGGDHHGAGIEHGAGAGHDAEASAFLRAQLDGFLAQVQFGAEGPDLLQQALDQLLRAAHRQRRDVVDGLVGIELGALAAGRRQRIDHMRLDAQQAELEDLEQAGRTGADDDRFGRDGFAHGRVLPAGLRAWQF